MVVNNCQKIIYSVGAVIGVLIYLFVGPEGCPNDPPEQAPPFLYGSLFAFVGIQLLAIIVENVIFSISAKGPIYDRQNKRRWLPCWLLTRVLLFIVETEVVIVCTVAVFGPAPYGAGALQCQEYHDGPLVFARVVVVTLIVLLSMYAIGFAIFLDPLGLCHAPAIIGKLKEVIGEIDKDFDTKYYDNNAPWNLEHGEHKLSENVRDGGTSRGQKQSEIGLGRVLTKIKHALCCLNAGGKRSKKTALREVALALYTIFSDEDVQKGLVLSDIVAGMMLISRSQRNGCQICRNTGKPSCTCNRLENKFREVSLYEARVISDYTDHHHIVRYYVTLS